MQEGWKILTHDGRLPVPGGPRLWHGGPGSVLSHVEQPASLGLVWHDDLCTAVRGSGLWPLGRPSIALRVEVPGGGQVRRLGTSAFTRSLQVTRQAAEAEVDAAIEDISRDFGADGGEMAHEQRTWRRALARPGRRPDEVARCLRQALDARDLPRWRLERFETAATVWQVWARFAIAAPEEAMAARNALGERDAFQARHAWVARQADPAWRTWDPWTTMHAEFVSDPEGPTFQADLSAARAAYAAHFALTWCLASSRGWVRQPRDRLTIGLRDAYAHGLEIALPAGRETLGWSMAELHTRSGDEVEVEGGRTRR